MVNWILNSSTPRSTPVQKTIQESIDWDKAPFLSHRREELVPIPDVNFFFNKTTIPSGVSSYDVTFSTDNSVPSL